jgi:hypothetical protein
VHGRPRSNVSASPSLLLRFYPTRADLPLLTRSILDTLAPRKNEAIEEAKEAIDRALSEVGKPN